MKVGYSCTKWPGHAVSGVFRVDTPVQSQMITECGCWRGDDDDADVCVSYSCRTSWSTVRRQMKTATPWWRWKSRSMLLMLTPRR